MLTQLTTVKARLAIGAADVSQDDLLTRAIEAVSARFDRECGRTFDRTVGAVQQFPACETEIIAACYPIEGVTKFELKLNEATGWQEQLGVDYLIRSASVISLVLPLAPGAVAVGRLTYTGGYVPPGTVAQAGQTPLPKDLESAATEQVAAWYQNRDKLGLIRHWPSGGTYLVLSQLPLLPAVGVTLRRYQRWLV
jgi:hypothetical protein